jgi:hypothetical protein
VKESDAHLKFAALRCTEKALRRFGSELIRFGPPFLQIVTTTFVHPENTISNIMKLNTS